MKEKRKTDWKQNKANNSQTLSSDNHFLPIFFECPQVFINNSSQQTLLPCPQGIKQETCSFLWVWGPSDDFLTSMHIANAWSLSQLCMARDHHTKEFIIILFLHLGKYQLQKIQEWKLKKESKKQASKQRNKYETSKPGRETGKPKVTRSSMWWIWSHSDDLMIKDGAILISASVLHSLGSCSSPLCICTFCRITACITLFWRWSHRG